ncbi:MAG: hypothetical protein WCO44_05780 [Bacteroidota bacterium]
MMQIDELQIRVPGMSEEAGTALAKAVAERVAAALPAGTTDRYIPGLKIKMQGSFDENTDLMADRIASQILRQINFTM